MTDENLAVLANIIGAVESGGQVYGQRDYGLYKGAEIGKEVTITLGAYQNYGREAQALIKKIYKEHPDEFVSIDKDGEVESMLDYDWVSVKWRPNSTQQQVLIALISSQVGRKVQDELFRDLITKYIGDAESASIGTARLQMMWCEIEHLGGLDAVKRIFGRLSGNFSVDDVMVSLKVDQNDKSSDNQVGDPIYWSRHECCAKWIKRYAIEDNEMGVLIGSARIDENGHATGGSAGDQTGKEISTQEWYLHTKGWVVIRAKDSKAREKIAYAMERACANPKIGYDQKERYTAYDWCKHSNGGNYDPGAITANVETDCSALVRLCCAYAGIFVGDFYTGDEVDVLNDTGKFTILRDSKYTTQSAYLLRGDILVTKSKGHTVVVLTNGPKAEDTPAEKEPEDSGKHTFAVKNVYLGRKGNDVLLLAEILTARGLYEYGISPDMTCTNYLVASINAYQTIRRKQGVEIGTDGHNDGVCGPKMWADILGL